MPGLPLISVIVLTYNSAPYVVSTLNSILRQDYAGPVELIIGDDCSRDDTVNICQEWINRNSGRFVRCRIITPVENRGVVANYNACCKSSQGTWIKGIAGDDILMDDSLTSLYTYATIGEESKFFVSSSVKAFSEESQLAHPETLRSMLGEKDICIDLDYVLRHPMFFLPAPSFFIKRATLEEIGYCPELLRNVEDAPLMFSLLSKGYKLHHMAKATVYYRVHPQSITNASGHIYLARNRDIVFRSILLPCYDRFKRLYLNMYYIPTRYMIQTENKKRGRYKAIKLGFKILRRLYSGLFFWLIFSKCKTTTINHSTSPEI